MAEEVEMIPVDAAEPPKVANPLTAELKPLAKPATPAAPVKPAIAAAKPAVKLPTVSALKPGLKLPPKKPGATVLAMRPGLKLPPKPGTSTVSALKPGLKLPPKPGATASSLKPGLKLPPKPTIHKPGATVNAIPLPKPVSALPKPIAPATPVAPAAPAAEAPKPAEAATPATPMAEAPKSAAPVAPSVPPPVDKPKTVEAAKPANATVVVPKASSADKPAEKPMDVLKSVTQKLKGITQLIPQTIPQQAVLRKTGIIADGGEMSEAQKTAAKQKTARISLSDAMGVAPVKTENAPMKTIRIKRPIDIPKTSTQTNLKPLPKPIASSEADTIAHDNESTKVVESATATTKTPKEGDASTTLTQRKTMRISRPSGTIRPAGKFGIKRPSQAATTIAAENPQGEVGDIPDMPAVGNIPDMPMVGAAKEVSDGPMWLFSLSSIVQAAACVAMGVLAWYLYENTQTLFF